MKLVVLFLALPFSALEASEFRFNLNNGVFFSKTILEENPYSFSKSQLRFEFTQELGPRFKIHSQPQALFYGGDYLHEVEWKNFVSSLLEGKSKLDWEKRWPRKYTQEVRLRLYRTHASFATGNFEILVGRLRHGLGNTRVFLSPLDRLDDLATFVSEELERPGSDSFGLKGSVGQRLTFRSGYIWANQDGHFRSYLEGKFLLKEGLELEAVLGRLEPKTDGLGLGIQKSVSEGELKWETTLSTREFEKASVVFVGLVPQIQTKTQKQNFSRHNLSWEKSYSGDLTIALEYFHNGWGAKKTADYDFLSLLRGEDYYLARDYGGFVLKKTLSPLWSVHLRGVANFNDGSFNWSPQVSFSSPGLTIELVLKSVLFFGPRESEFGKLPDRISGSLAIYF